MFGRDREKREAREHEEEMAERRRASQAHSSALARPDDEGGAEILKYLAELDDLPVDLADDPVLGQMISKVASTGNLDEDDLRSQEWVTEYLALIAKMKYPPEYGVTGDRRGWARGDYSEAREPITEETKAALETLTGATTKIARSRSENFEGVKEASRNVQESVLREDREKSVSGSGLLDKIPGL